MRKENSFETNCTMKKIVVTASNRGIGFSFVQTYLKNANNFVIATCRDPQSAFQLQELQKSNSNQMQILPIDFHDESSIEEASRTIKEQHSTIDILLNVPGILKPEKSLQMIDIKVLEEVFKTNCFVIHPFSHSKLVRNLNASLSSQGHLLMMKHFQELLSRKVKGKPEEVGSQELGKIVNISARVGSIGDNNIGGWYSYRSSKTALNQMTKCAALELKRKGVVVVSLHPGTVRTDFTKVSLSPYSCFVSAQSFLPSKKPYITPTKQGVLEPSESTEKLANIINNLTLADTGKFVDQDNKMIEW